MKKKNCKSNWNSVFSFCFFFRSLILVEKTQPIQIVSGSMNDVKKRFSLGLELSECTLDCSIELCESSAANSMQDSSPLINYTTHSYDMDESLGILTPDQMIEFLDTNASIANLQLPSSLPIKFLNHKCQIDHTPSPEELPLDPVEVKSFNSTKSNENVGINSTTNINNINNEHDAQSQSESFIKNDQMTKSTTSKATTNSFITSVTSIASLDNGYQGDGEMSRPASRGAEKSSPLRRVNNNNRQNKLHGYSNNENAPVVRRQDPMTDSDFFTESDADDIFHRGDRRVQIIDGHMYNAQGADIFIDEAQQNEYSCMDSSGIYTDVEHRTEDDSSIQVHQNQSNKITETQTNTADLQKQRNSSKNDLENEKQKSTTKTWTSIPTQSTQSIATTLSNSSSSTMNDSAATTYNMCSVTNGGDHSQQQQNTVISDASTNSNVKISRVLQSNSRSDDENSKTPNTIHKSNSIKVKKSSPNRKQCKNDSNKRNDIVKREIKLSPNTRNRSRSNATIGNDKNSPESSSPSMMTATNSENGGNSNMNIVHSRKNTPNKWDAVMNKIALNKAEVKTKKNYNEVKSKVTCGLKRSSPNQIKTPASEPSTTTSDSGISSLTITASKLDTNKSPITPLARQTTFGITKRLVIYLSSQLQ